MQPSTLCLTAPIRNQITFEQSLYLIGALFPDRVIVTETAFSSATESHDFQYATKAFDLLIKLVTNYWEGLGAGKPDAEARKVFGNSYAAKEAESLSIDGRKRRTFLVDGRPVEMQRHLKIGVKDSSATTLRIHFEWIASERKVAIGYCGPHLDF